VLQTLDGQTLLSQELLELLVGQPLLLPEVPVEKLLHLFRPEELLTPMMQDLVIDYVEEGCLAHGLEPASQFVAGVSLTDSLDEVTFLALQIGLGDDVTVDPGDYLLDDLPSGLRRQIQVQGSHQQDDRGQACYSAHVLILGSYGYSMIARFLQLVV
jgi:hypothetical protein